MDKKYMEIYNIIKNQIISQELKPGEKLLSIRQLMRKYHVSSKTIEKVILQLKNSGFINSAPCRGLYVQNNIAYKMAKENQFILNSYNSIEFANNSTIDFANAELNELYFDKKLYKNLINKVVKSHDFNSNSIAVEGVPELIEIVDDWLEEDGIFVDKSNIIITSGTQQCIDIILKTFYNRKRTTIAVSDPVHYKVISLLKTFADVKGVHLLTDGWDFEDFEKILRQNKIDFVYENSNFQNPTGITWSYEKKKKLLELAKQYDFYIIEEDNYSHFYYGNNRPVSFKSIDKTGEERVFYIRDFSKIISKELQVSLLVVPPSFKKKTLAEKLNTESQPTLLSQLIMKQFFIDGHMDKLLNKIVPKLKKRHDFMIKRLEKIKNIRIMSYPNGGFFIWIKFLTPVDEEELFQLCLEKGVVLLPGYIFYEDMRQSSKARLCFIHSSLKDIQKGISVLKEICKN